MYLNTYAAEFTNGAFNSTAPTSSVFSLGAGFAGSGTGIAYCWHSVEGYSKFGKYTGNGNADGPFIYTGFRPRMVFEKAIDTSNSRWTVQDSARSIHNPAISILNWDESQAEYDATSRAVDIYSNGFKIRTSDVAINQSGNDYIYGAWGDVPFKYNNTF